MREPTSRAGVGVGSSCHVVEITHGPSGRRVSKPLTLMLPQTSSRGEEILQRHVTEAFSWKMPALIQFTLQSSAATELAKQVMLSNSGSKATLYQYMYGVHRYCSYLNKAPDQLICECRGQDGQPLTSGIARHVKQIEQFMLDLKASGLAPGTISNHVKGVKALYRANGLNMELPYRISRRVIYGDRAPSQAELSRLMEVANVRGRAIVSMLSLGGFRVGTLSQLNTDTSRVI